MSDFFCRETRDLKLRHWPDIISHRQTTDIGVPAACLRLSFQWHSQMDGQAELTWAATVDHKTFRVGLMWRL